MVTKKQAVAHAGLITSGLRLDLLEKASCSAAGVVHIELEDGVPEALKPKARETIVQALRCFDWTGQRTFVRIDSTDDNVIREDIAAILPGRPTGFLLGKCMSARTVEFTHQVLTEAERRYEIAAGIARIAVMIERMDALANIDDIATASERVAALSFGPGDLGVEYGYRRSFQPLELETLVPRSLTVMAAHKAGLEAWDSVYLFYHQAEETAAAARWSYRLGFDLQKCVTPRQVDIVAREFGPSAQDVEWARGVVRGEERAKNSDNSAVWASAGTMNDGPTVVLAHEYLTWNARGSDGTGADERTSDGRV